MNRPLVVLAVLVLAACEPSDPQPAPGAGDVPAMTPPPAAASVDTTGLRELVVPAEFASGEQLFRANCAQCHGEAALGTEQGPPLVHIVYEPNHHADAAFQLAAVRGVRAHHWSFGDMPAVTGVSQQDVGEIVRYVRWLQREAGVY